MTSPSNPVLKPVTKVFKAVVCKDGRITYQFNRLLDGHVRPDRKGWSFQHTYVEVRPGQPDKIVYYTPEDLSE